ncbi:MAG: ABC transporter permease, partial [Halocynthiibacter sp.]
MIKFNIWSLGSLIIAAIVLLPIIALFWMAFTPSENIWPHLISTTLPRYASNSAILMLSVGALSAAMGTGSAFLMVMYRFPGQKWLQWALLLPLAVPAYIGAYALVDFLEYAGPVQTSLRSLFGWQNARDYWFPEIRSVFFAVIVLSASLYPYVYLMTRSALEEQSGNSYEVARALGAGPIASLMRVAIPLARPAIAAASAIVMMEVVSDFGTSDFFAVQTLTTGIFTIWLDANNAAGAAQIACLILIVVLTLLGLEKGSRRNMRLAGSARNARPISKNTIHGAKGYILFALCFIPFFIGFLLPFSVILWNASKSTIGWAGDGLSQALLNTLFTGGMAAAITVLAALFLVYGVRLSQSTTARTLLPATTIGYAAPGAVLAVGILIPFAWADNRLADLILSLTGTDPGLLLTGTSFALILAFCIRFFAIAQG